MNLAVASLVSAREMDELERSHPSDVAMGNVQ